MIAIYVYKITEIKYKVWLWSKLTKHWLLCGYILAVEFKGWGGEETWWTSTHTHNILCRYNQLLALYNHLTTYRLTRGNYISYSMLLLQSTFTASKDLIYSNWQYHVPNYFIPFTYKTQTNLYITQSWLVFSEI